MRRLLVSLLIAFGLLAASYAYATLSSMLTTGADIGAAMLLWPAMVLTPFFMIAGGAYFVYADRR